MRPYLIISIFLLSLVQQGCFSFSSRPTLDIESMDLVGSEKSGEINKSFSKANSKVSSLRALLRVRAQKIGFVQEASAAYVYSRPSMARLTFFATQFNRLLALMVADSDHLGVYLPDEKVLLTGEPNTAAMSGVLGVPFSVDEFTSWLLGVLPASSTERKIYWDEEHSRFLSEQVLESGDRLRASFIEVKNGIYQVQSVEVLDEEGPFFYSSMYWSKLRRLPTESDKNSVLQLAPVAHSVDFSRERISLRIDISRLETADHPIDHTEAKRVFKLPELKGVERVAIDSLYKSGGSLLFPR